MWRVIKRRARRSADRASPRGQRRPHTGATICRGGARRPPAPSARSIESRTTGAPTEHGYGILRAMDETDGNTIRNAARAVREHRGPASFFTPDLEFARECTPSDQIDVVFVRRDGWLVGCSAKDAEATQRLFPFVARIDVRRDATGAPTLRDTFKVVDVAPIVESKVTDGASEEPP